MRRALLLLASLMVAALVGWAYWPRPVEVEMAEVGVQTITVTVEEEGVAEIREVYLVTAPIAGRLQRVGLHAGDPVEAERTVVASIGPVVPPLLDARARAMAEAGLDAAGAAVDLARAQVAQAEVALAYRRAEAERAVALFQRAAVSQHLRDLALVERDTAEAALESARAALAMRERERDSAAAALDGEAGGDGNGDGACCLDLRAPVTGQVLRVLTEDNQVVAPGTPILEVGDPADLMVRVDLLSRDVVRVPMGAPAIITGWGGPDLSAEVERIGPAARTRVSALGIEEQRVEVWLRLTGTEDGARLPGHAYRVTARITLWQGQDVPAVPVGALFRSGADWAVYALREGRAQLVPVAIGARDDRFAQVFEGLAPGEQVILHASDKVADGTRVRPLP